MIDYLQVCPEDFMSFDLILGIDDSNAQELANMAKTVGKSAKAKVDVLSSYLNAGSEEIHDPFFVSVILPLRLQEMIRMELNIK